VADVAAGMYVYSGILCALLERASSGTVRAVEVSLFEAPAVDGTAAQLRLLRRDGSPTHRRSPRHHCPYGPYPTRDGTVLLAVQNEREWQALCTKVLRVPDLAKGARFSTNAARVAHRAELSDTLCAALAAIDTDTAVAQLKAASIACARPAGRPISPGWPGTRCWRAATAGSPWGRPAGRSRPSSPRWTSRD
jgi:crotonobetainyl-CoA:carnitine CoA-transferase CaiB-like acyl-CoA transferase